MARARMTAAFAAGVGVGLFVAACGATDQVAPPAESQGDIQQCRSFEQLMPAFVRSLDTGKTANLKVVIENHLLVPLREGDAPPVNDVLRAVFTLLNRLALKPPEAGAAQGQYCAPASSPPPLAQANELCELRRTMDVMVHQGKGLDALKLFDPQLRGILDYITGRGADGKPHYEVAAIFSGMCAQDANCQLVNGLDLVIAFSDFAPTTEGKKMFDDLYTLAMKPSVQAMMSGSNNMTEDDFVAIGKALVPAVQGADAAALDKAFKDLPLPADLKADLTPVVEDMKLLLGKPDLMGPTKKALVCFTAKDKNWDVVRMLHRLAIRDKKPEFGITRLTQALKDLQAVDTRGALMFLAGTLARAERADEEAIDSTASVCRALLSTSPQAGQARSNAELALPVISDLVQAGVLSEAMCAADTLLFGCAGGKQPACPSP